MAFHYGIHNVTQGEIDGLWRVYIPESKK